MQPQPYAGTPDAPYPPVPAGWSEVPVSDRAARARAHALVDQLALYHYVDERGPRGVTRFFAYETPFGRSVSAVSAASDGTLGATNPSFAAPSAAQVAANPPGQPLSDAGVALLTDFGANGVPSEHASDPLVIAFQNAWNADPLSQVNGSNGTLDVDGGYGPNVHDALASIAGGSAPPVNTGPAPAPSPTPTPTPGQTTPEVAPVTDATCGSWVVDATNPQAVAIASNLAHHDTPAPWVDQGDYQTTIGGVDYFFGMSWSSGMKAVIAYRCTSGPASGGGTTPPATASTTSSSSAAPAVIIGTLLVGGLVAVGFAAKKPLRAMYHPHR